MNAKRLVYALAILGLALGGIMSPASAKPRQVGPASDFVAGEVVAVFSDEVADTDAQAAALAANQGGVVAAVRGTSALLRFDPSVDVAAVANEIGAQAGVRFAEPNYIYRIPEPISPSAHAGPPQYVIRQAKGSDRQFAVPIAALQAMKTRKGSKITATYPNDPYLWYSHAYNDVNAAIVWSNPTPSKNVCEIDTGVDNLHPDLSGKIVLGKDFVNEDLLPMDDNGHGTHVAGIMVAAQNNGKGLGGIAPNAKVVAVKALNAQGEGTNFDVSAAIRYCADRTDINIINMSLSGPYAHLLEQAVDYATNTKIKLLVAAAGNDGIFSYCGDGTDVRTYPAGFTKAADAYDLDPLDPEFCTTDGTDLHPEYPGVVAVASSGDYDLSDNYDPWARSPFSNYGPWVTFIAPGMDIYSTLPYDKPFDLYYQGFPSRYGSLSGTSMAAPAASATFARGWGYILSMFPTAASDPDLNVEIKDYVFDHSFWLGYDFGDWPVEQPDRTPKANVAMALERGAAYGFAVDATTGNAIPNTTMQVYLGTSLKGSATAGKDTGVVGGTNEAFAVPASWAEIINLPQDIYTPKVSATGYTAAPAGAFVNWDSPNGELAVFMGWWNEAGYASVPPKTANFSAVSTWYSYDISDLDQVAFLPPLPKSDGQPAQFEVYSYYEDTFGKIGNVDPADNPPDGTGSLGVFPFARHIRRSEITANWAASNSEATVVRNRFVTLGAGFPANLALPYYTGSYEFWVSDWGQFFDGPPYDGAENPGELPGLSEFSDDYSTPHLTMFIWKDGLLKMRVVRGQVNAGACGAGEHAWHAVTITSSASGTATISPVDECHLLSEVPYGDIDLFQHAPIP